MPSKSHPVDSCVEEAHHEPTDKVSSDLMGRRTADRPTDIVLSVIFWPAGANPDKLLGGQL